MSQQQSRKNFLAKVLGLAAVGAAIPQAFVKQAADKVAVRPAGSKPPVNPAVEPRAVARRNDSL